MDKPLIASAMELTVKAHQNQVRKGSDIPYLIHPLAVGMILAKAGCSGEVIAAGMLHDTIEDTSLTLACIRDALGERVSSIVKGASEPDKSLSWEERKGHTIAYLKTAPLEVRFVALADKLDNIRAIASDYEGRGDAIWEIFNRGKDDQKWYYESLVQVLGDGSVDHSYQILHKQFERKVSEVFGTKK